MAVFRVRAPAAVPPTIDPEMKARLSQEAILPFSKKVKGKTKKVKAEGPDR